MKKNAVKTVLAILFSASLVVNCSDKDEPAAPLNKCFVATISTDDGLFNLNYTSDNKLKTFVGSYMDDGVPVTETTTVTYDSKGNITKAAGPEYYTEYLYNANNQVTRENDYENDVMEDRTDYEYNSSGQLVTKKYYQSLSDGTFEVDNYYTFEYSSTASKNPTKANLHYADGEIFATYTYEYDTKNMPHSAVTTSVIFAEVAAEENNVTKIVEIYPDSESVTTTTYSYVYNEKGYPTKITETVSYTGGSTYSYVSEYTYDCK